MLEKLFLAVEKLEAYTVLNITQKVISEVANTTEATERLGLKAE